MAVSSMHIRCNSVPSAPHPVVSEHEEHLRRLKDSSSLSSSSVSHKLNGLLDLHDCTDKLLHLPIKQQDLARECSDKCVNGLLEVSLRILDICITAKDCLLTSKASMHKLQSVIRRRRGDRTGFTIEAGKYLDSRKKMKKTIRKALGDLKAMKSESVVSSSDKDHVTFSMLSILKESEEVTVTLLESLLLFISEPKGQSKQIRWSAMLKLMQPKRVACDSQESQTNEFEKVDAALRSLINDKPSTIENFQSHMENLEMCIQDLEISVEQLSRKLIRTRVSLLNIFNH
ncbi:hypothetical protein RIF29_13064 [Crotalaria pallida]|uniref:Uncharacterized protein n=1 Tax=Crotalaria pallida TaxID=3830 RepID=A0AAN9P2P1_CROPI